MTPNELNQQIWNDRYDQLRAAVAAAKASGNADSSEALSHLDLVALIALAFSGNPDAWMQPGPLAPLRDYLRALPGFTDPTDLDPPSQTRDAHEFIAIGCLAGYGRASPAPAGPAPMVLEPSVGSGS